MAPCTSGRAPCSEGSAVAAQGGAALPGARTTGRCELGRTTRAAHHDREGEARRRQGPGPGRAPPGHPHAERAVERSQRPPPASHRPALRQGRRRTGQDCPFALSLHGARAIGGCAPQRGQAPNRTRCPRGWGDLRRPESIKKRARFQRKWPQNH